MSHSAAPSQPSQTVSCLARFQTARLCRSKPARAAGGRQAGPRNHWDRSFQPRLPAPQARNKAPPPPRRSFQSKTSLPMPPGATLRHLPRGSPPSPAAPSCKQKKGGSVTLSASASNAVSVLAFAPALVPPVLSAAASLDLVSISIPSLPRSAPSPPPAAPAIAAVLSTATSSGSSTLGGCATRTAGEFDRDWLTRCAPSRRWSPRAGVSPLGVRVSSCLYRCKTNRSTLKTRAELWQAIERGGQQALPPRSGPQRKEIGRTATCPNTRADTEWQEPLTEPPCLKREPGVGMHG